MRGLGQADRFDLTRSQRLLLVAAWAAAEATVWPIMPDALLVPLAASRPGHWWALVLVAAGGSLGGGLLSYAVGRAAPVEPFLRRLPLVSPPMIDAASTWLAEEGPRGVRHQPLSGLPFKVFALLAGARRLPLGQFLLWSLVARGARFGTVSGSAALLGRALAPRLRAFGWLLLPLWGVVFLVGLRQTTEAWERRGLRGERPD
jgi:1-acyl-sn-glycerol-3-phosphate acyltransferase